MADENDFRLVSEIKFVKQMFDDEYTDFKRLIDSLLVKDKET